MATVIYETAIRKGNVNKPKIVIHSMTGDTGMKHAYAIFLI
jgi:hypothetical protein